MSSHEFTLFDTPIGRCGIVWGGRGIVGLQLPERDERGTRKRLSSALSRCEQGAPSAEIRAAIEQIVDLAFGREATDLSEIALDMERVARSERQVYAIARRIPPGETLTYGEIAERLGDKLLARDVGQAMGKNPFPIVVPCHRVVAAGGKLGGFSAPRRRQYQAQDAGDRRRGGERPAGPVLTAPSGAATAACYANT